MEGFFASGYRRNCYSVDGIIGGGIAYIPLRTIAGIGMNSIIGMRSMTDMTFVAGMAGMVIVNLIRMAGVTGVTTVCIVAGPMRPV